ncbi:Zinc finger PHD-type [Arabidopsis suecica]|uniref:Zinc finger PHD-type n=1 Tax=Arabidopsis suecica TaxID=45249 RepID=A0A8T2DVL4_ARASU|nr:Zinc finger PHD-type [Arabidopsis suecica]
MDTSAVQLPFRDYSLQPAPRYINARCHICSVTGAIYNGYFCNDPIVWMHKECVELPSEINHLFHPQHPLLLTYEEGWWSCFCALCGETKPAKYFYSCSTCKIKVDLTCGMNPPPPAIEHPICHDHPLVFLKKRQEKTPCEVCKNRILGSSYSCLGCELYFHVGCIHLSKEVNHPCHSDHPLMLVESESLTDNDKKTCFLCGQQPHGILYHCSICNFTLCIGCIKSPPPLVVENVKTHKHPLTFFPRGVYCTCNVCGVKGLILSYMCLQCGFAVHCSCVDLPQVMNINRHDHRISFTQHLGPGYLNCGVCRRSVCQFNGAYSCLVCPNYAVHSRCATRYDIWDGVELEGKAENIEDIAPFKVVGDDLIRHFSHSKHSLRLHKNNIIYDDSTRCEACGHPVEFGRIYNCEECCFILHEKCANLPMKKRLVFSTLPFLLLGPGNDVCKVLDCKLCGMFFTGFEYKSQERRQSDIDVHCGSLTEPFVHDGHLHPLYFDQKQKELPCNACQKTIRDYMLCCADCDFNLCLWCASLPKKIRHSNDEHILTLCCGEEANGKYWCDICEAELDPSKWFYTCFGCGGTLHVECVLGDFSRLMPGCTIDYRVYTVEVVFNNHNTRPMCSRCHSRCKVSVILKFREGNIVYFFCSRSCFLMHFSYYL